MKIEKAHGRIETRSIQIRAINPSEVHFAHARTLILIKRECHYCNSEKKDTVEWAWQITSKDSRYTTPEELLSISRGHWTIEGIVHYCRDMTFHEDRSNVRNAVGARMMANLRNSAIALCSMNAPNKKNITSQNLLEVSPLISIRFFVL